MLGKLDWRRGDPLLLAAGAGGAHHPLPHLLHVHHLAQAAQGHLSFALAAADQCDVDNYVDLFTRLEFSRTSATASSSPRQPRVISVFISCLAAYSLVRLHYPGRDWIGRLILFSYLTPAALLFIPLSVIINQLAPGQLAHRPHLRLPHLFGAAQHLAAHGLLPQHSGRPGGAGHGRRLHTRLGLASASCCRWPRPGSWPSASSPSPAPGTSCCWPSSSSPRRPSRPCPSPSAT